MSVDGEVMTCDADCTRARWIECELDYGDGGFVSHVSVSRDTWVNGDMLGQGFICFDHDQQEMVEVSGWLLEAVARIGDETEDSIMESLNNEERWLGA